MIQRRRKRLSIGKAPHKRSLRKRRRGEPAARSPSPPICDTFRKCANRNRMDDPASLAASPEACGDSTRSATPVPRRQHLRPTERSQRCSRKFRGDPEVGFASLLAETRCPSRAHSSHPPRAARLPDLAVLTLLGPGRRWASIARRNKLCAGGSLAGLGLIAGWVVKTSTTSIRTLGASWWRVSAGAVSCAIARARCGGR